MKPPTDCTCYGCYLAAQPYTLCARCWGRLEGKNNPCRCEEKAE